MKNKTNIIVVLCLLGYSVMAYTQVNFDTQYPQLQKQVEIENKFGTTLEDDYSNLEELENPESTELVQSPGFTCRSLFCRE